MRTRRAKKVPMHENPSEPPVTFWQYVNADKVSSVASAVGMASWGGLSLGMTQRQVSELIGKPQKVEGVDYAIWWYGGMRVSFAHGKLCHWSDPAR